MSNIRIHQLKIDFKVTEEISRFVYVYIIEAKALYLIDSGVFGCQKQIAEYLDTIGRKLEEIKGIFLTHAHPDHIGSAAWLQEHTGCKIYASAGEAPWIEDIDLQFRERPIPNFHKLAGKSSRVDVIIKDGELITPEEGLQIRAIRSAGHSQDGMSYDVDGNIFIGDAVPVKGDLPIFINEQETRNSLELLANIPDAKAFYPAWDQIYTPELMKEKLAEAFALMDLLKKTVTAEDDGCHITELTDKVCHRLQMPMLKTNPLFQRSIASMREA